VKTDAKGKSKGVDTNKIKEETKREEGRGPVGEGGRKENS